MSRPGQSDEQMERICALLQQARRAFPGQRVGQLLENATYPDWREVFYITDDELEAGLRLLLSGRSGRQP